MRVAAKTLKLLALLLLALVAAAAATTNAHPYRNHWKHETFGKRALVGTGIRAGFAQARNSPKQWGTGASGFGKRAGAGFATHGIRTTVEHSIAAPLHEDLHYHPSTERGFGPRLRHALVSTVVTRNTKTGKKTPAGGRIAGHAAAGAFSQAVIPATSGASTAGVGLAADAGANVAREFWPHHKKSQKRHG